MKSYLNSYEQEVLFVLGAIAGTLERIINDLEDAGKSSTWLQYARTYTLKHTDEMVRPLSEKRRKEYIDRLNRREIVVVDRGV